MGTILVIILIAARCPLAQVAMQLAMGYLPSGLASSTNPRHPARGRL